MTIEILLTQGKVAVIDDADVPLIDGYSWHALKVKRTFYAVATITMADGRQGTLAMHRLLMNAPAGSLVDHKDRNGLNNQRKNIRFSTVHQNSVNRIPVGTTSKYKGVRHTAGGNWQARIGGRCERTLGTFTTEEEAARAYDAAAKDAYGEFAYLNLE